jgi:hypothetical protein
MVACIKSSTVAAALAFLAIPAIAGAHAGNNGADVVHACVGNISKVVRVVGVSGSCISSPPLVAETPAHWAIQGPQGAPGLNGTDGAPGINGTNGIDGTDGTNGTNGIDGVKGERGLAGNLALAGLVCPNGTFVKGFNVAGQILCGAPGGTGTVPPEFTPPITLPQAGAIQTFLANLTGSEGNARISFLPTSVPGVGTLEGYVDVLGFALCQPPDPAALPAASPPLFGCLPNVSVSFVANSPAEATLTVDAPHAFVRVGGGRWTVESSTFFDASGPIDGFAQLAGAHIQFHVALLDTGDGRKRFGPATTVSFESQSTHIELELGGGLIGTIGELISNLQQNLLLSEINSRLRTIVGTAVGEALGALPPFDLHP